VLRAALGVPREPSGVLRAARVLLAVVALAVLASGCGQLGHGDANLHRAETVTIVRAVDGDTIRLAGSGDASRLRLIGQDTPETHQPNRGVECGGPQASASMAALLAGHRRGRLVSDPGQDSRDRYGRRLGYLEVAGRDVAETQIRRGWATVYVYEHRRFARYQRYRAAQADAERHRRGVWGLCGGDFHRLADG
jgi:micrococcal nuclease